MSGYEYTLCRLDRIAGLDEEWAQADHWLTVHKDWGRLVFCSMLVWNGYWHIYAHSNVKDEESDPSNWKLFLPIIDSIEYGVFHHHIVKSDIERILVEDSAVWNGLSLDPRTRRIAHRRHIVGSVKTHVSNPEKGGKRSFFSEL